MRFKKSVLTVGVMVVVSLGLAGCQSGANQVKQKDIHIVQDAQSSHARIWYMVYAEDGGQSVAKDSAITAVWVTKANKVTVYNTDGYLTMTDLDKKSDKQIIDMAKKDDKKNYSDDVARGKQESEELTKQLKEEYKESKAEVASDKKDLKSLSKSDYSYSDTKKDLKEKQSDVKYYPALIKQFKKISQKTVAYQQPKAGKLSAEIKTDSSGNSTTAEQFHYKKFEYTGAAQNTATQSEKMSGEENSNSAIKAVCKPASNLRGSYHSVVFSDTQTRGYAFPILNEKYTGYSESADPENSNDTAYWLITKTQAKEPNANFDTSKTKNVTEVSDLD
ncbi:hypothetical protein [Loigolactobacillus bifermentans]|nr:hypothetical protein [Loigolactobacillus bifermentans]QGG61342.1 hypothetical protein LB003_13165 [Loigolactobacillus bifermentans]